MCLQVCLLQGEQRSLLSALEAVESALHDARHDCDEQTTLRQRYESALEHKTHTISDLRRELKEARKVAEQVNTHAPLHPQDCGVTT